ncbi:hypothetical protein I316_04744 [Kwoniella heveanensis BCC8398]|uniref:FAS1 domain-containing protein n=1 Tax=Kwoniella heveanensis BCC8398 TaxID=1296120 RepID=A0A1B9GRH1_9TREE|nr:hypothetical protein I316_04744 [Kwoniella heveanensis BCC8398]
MKFATLSALLLAPALALAQSESASASASASASGSSAASPSATGEAAPGDGVTSYLTTLLGALNAANLTGLVGVASGIANTTEGLALLTELSQGNKTVFAPSNEAFSAVPQEVASNTTLLTQILSYHILNNSYTPDGVRTAPNHTIARSLLRGGNYTLPGNFSAPLVLSKSSSGSNSTSSGGNSTESSNSTSAFNINGPTSNVSATGPVAAANLQVYIINEVLSLPPSVSEVAGDLFPSLAGVIGQTGLLDPIAAAQGITIFAPNDAAFAGLGDALGQLNNTQISTILANHVINGTVVYSTGLTSSNYTSAAGEPFTFLSNGTGVFVQSANSTARIIQSDIIINNGVVHLIDGVLVNTGSNPEAAASAYSSGVAAAATSTEATAPVTATSEAAPTGSQSGSSGGSSAGQKLEAPAFTNAFVGGALALIGVVIGGGFTLM